MSYCHDVGRESGGKKRGHIATLFKQRCKWANRRCEMRSTSLSACACISIVVLRVVFTPLLLPHADPLGGGGGGGRGRGVSQGKRDTRAYNSLMWLVIREESSGYIVRAVLVHFVAPIQLHHLCSNTTFDHLRDLVWVARVQTLVLAQHQPAVDTDRGCKEKGASKDCKRGDSDVSPPA